MCMFSAATIKQACTLTDTQKHAQTRTNSHAHMCVLSILRDGQESWQSCSSAGLPLWPRLQMWMLRTEQKP